MEVFRMAEEHCAFWTESERDDIAVGVLETAHKAEHIARKGQQMGPGKTGLGAGWRQCRDHTQSFCRGTTLRVDVMPPLCGKARKYPQRLPTRWTPWPPRDGVSSSARVNTRRVHCLGGGLFGI